MAGGKPYIGTTDHRLVGYGDAEGTPPEPQPEPQPPPQVVHDLAITSLTIPDRVSRQAGAMVKVEVSNLGTEPESYSLLVRVQPGMVIGSIHGVDLKAGEKRVASVPWLGGLMGNDGPKSIVAQLTLQGAQDSQLANNLVTQVVTVGP